MKTLTRLLLFYCIIAVPQFPPWDIQSFSFGHGLKRTPDWLSCTRHTPAGNSISCSHLLSKRAGFPPTTYRIWRQFRIISKVGYFYFQITCIHTNTLNFWDNNFLIKQYKNVLIIMHYDRKRVGLPHLKRGSKAKFSFVMHSFSNR